MFYGSSNLKIKKNLFENIWLGLFLPDPTQSDNDLELSTSKHQVSRLKHETLIKVGI